jgi:energy-coupling factor transporter ATP-binding protein EcfA2
VSHDAYDRELLRRQIDRLRQAAASREKLEREIVATFDRETAAARAESDAEIVAVKEAHARESGAARRALEEAIRNAEKLVADDRSRLAQQRKDKAAEINRAWKNGNEEVQESRTFDELTVAEQSKHKRSEPGKRLRRSEKELATIVEALDKADSQARSFLGRIRRGPSTDAAPAQDAEPLPTGSSLVTHLEQLREAVEAGKTKLLGLKAVATAFSGGMMATAIAIPILLGGLAAAAVFLLLPASLADSMSTKAAAAAGALFVLGGGGAACGWWLVGRMRGTAVAEATALHDELAATIARAKSCHAGCAEYLRKRHDADVVKLEQTLAEEARVAREAFETRVKALAEKRDKSLADLETKCAEYEQKIEQRRAASCEAAQKKYPPLIEKLDADCTSRLATLESDRDARLAAAATRRDDDWAKMTEDWRTARTDTAAVFDEAARIDAEAFRDWGDLARGDVALPATAPPGLRFGNLALSLESIPGGVSQRPDFNGFGPISWKQPAIVPFPVEASLLIKTTADQKEVASDMMQALMLRIASGVPAGQTRFTIIDPLGLGKQFAGFMHLADYDELLVTSRIWTEPPLIEQKLADITEQIELVIQKYLRNEYESIGAYNAAAEVPEPYRFVVVANFPANFTETSARRLASIAASGARCGVYTIVSIDGTQTVPANFSIDDIEKHSTTLVLKNGVYTWNDPEFRKWPLSVEQPPPDDVFTRIIQRVGKAAQAAKRVEVPFDRVAPEEGKWWHGSTANEVVAPLGPAGAKKIQSLKLGKGTSQHCLIAGKTGSGKSTLMHAMITSLALQYSPNEIQFYLIDFKKGVEFKLYDHYKLPHARVIAIESEREFGLSVMEQLDRELKRRGDLFRELSVQNVAGFRETGHPDPMPRILLIIDEFQEIFVEDDKIAQDAALILDRLVRQGRAFGMHVLLGSQTLGGSYSLPRATMGQMAIRIALQCNEADSSLILSEDNTAARLLTRPGEAIYNDANGMIEGNNNFQVVFLTDERREWFLGKLRELADRRTDIPALPRIVFDGNEAANPAGNGLLSELLDSGTVAGKPPVAPLAWLGDAIAIKDPTAAIFRRQGGANLLIVGQREDLGVSLLAMAMMSLAVGHDPHPGGCVGRAARFVVLEPAIAQEKPDIMLARLAPSLPHEVEMVNPLGVGDAVARLADEVKRRIEDQVLDGEAVFVIIRDLARFRELRRNESDFGYSMSGDAKATPAQNLVTLLKDGPPVGVHVLVWCDSLTNLQRTFERATLKEFELRVIFQMSGSDSSQLVDSPAAVKLGPQRALFVHEETGTLEKFRPYSFPADDWLATVSAALKARPQGTPAERPVARPTAAPRPATGDGFGITGGFGADEFNFTKFLDDPPGGEDAAKP